MVAFISLQPVVAFSTTTIMVLAPLLLPLMLAMSSTTENSKTQPERSRVSGMLPRTMARIWISHPRVRP
jgi:hypothetical protein